MIKTAEKTSNSWIFKGDPRTPKRVAELLREKVIGPTDLLLIWVIDALSRENSDVGCYASTKYLARSAGVHEINVYKRLASLEEQGFLIRVVCDGKRYIELEWTRTAEERAAMDTKYGKLLRKAHRKLVRRLEEKDPPSGSASVGASGSARTPPSGSASHNYKENNKGNKVERGAEKLSAPPPVNRISSLGQQTTHQSNGHAHLTGKSNSNGYHLPKDRGIFAQEKEEQKRKDKEKAESFMKDARKLHESLRENKRVVQGTVLSSALQLRLLKIKDKQKYKKLLKWYCENCSLENQKFYGLPSISNGKQFRKCFPWIEERYLKDENKRNPGIWVEEEQTEIQYIPTDDGEEIAQPVTTKVRRKVLGKFVKGDNGRPKFVAD